MIYDLFFFIAGKDGSLSVLDLSLVGVQIKYFQTESFHAIAGSLASIKVALQALRE